MRALGRLVIAALLIASGRSEGQQPDNEEAPGADAALKGCRSVVLVECSQGQQKAAPSAEPADPLQATKQKLDAHRLRQMQAQAGLNAIEVTGERPSAAESDPWQGFSRSVAGAAAPDCLSPNASGLPRTGPLQAQGLLALPLAAREAAVGKCR